MALAKAKLRAERIEEAKEDAERALRVLERAYGDNGYGARIRRLFSIEGQ
jgi:hypothetical protein